MGIDIHPYVECDFQNSCMPFSSPDSVRSINSGEFFVWRSPELFHALGLDYWELDLPESPLSLGQIPNSLSQTIVENEGLITSPFVTEKTKVHRIPSFPNAQVLEWESDQVQFFPIENPLDYHLNLKNGETLILDPGCELPNHASTQAIRAAIEQCGIGGERIDYFLAIVELMERMCLCLSPDHVRMVYWFDNLGPQFMKRYREKRQIPSGWSRDDR